MFSQATSLLAKPHIKELMKILKSSNSNEHMQALHIQGILTYLSKGYDQIYNGTIMTDASRYLDKHYKENVPVDELASQFILSRYHFSREFKREIGSSPHHYLLNRRLIEAKQLLANTDMTVEVDGHHTEPVQEDALLIVA